MANNSSPALPKILLIGVGGQVGWELWPRLQSLGDVVATRHLPSNDADLQFARPLDLNDVDAIRAAVRETCPNVIVNAAAYTAVDKAETEQDLAMKINTVAPGVLAEEARRCGAAIVHYSTDYVFDGSGDRPWREDDPKGPLNVYGRSKLAGEEAIRSSGAAHLILRTSWVYGVRGQNFVKTMLRLGASRDELRVVCDQFGAPTSARTIADATCRILADSGQDPIQFFNERGGVAHLCGAGETSWHGFAEEIFQRAREMALPLKVSRVLPIASAEYPTPAERPKNSRLDCSRLRDRFGIVLPSWQSSFDELFAEIITRRV